VCPYCKTVLASTSEQSPALSNLAKLYEQGKIEEALPQIHLLKQQEDMQSDATFLMLAGKISLEAESPTSQICTFFTQASMQDGPHQAEAKLYNEMMTARKLFKEGLNDPGEKWFNAQLALHPNNPHLYFLLGAHTFWVDQETRSSAANLERCVQIRPALARAWGCLFAIYKKLGDKSNMQRCIQHYSEISQDERTLEFMREQMG
jgi:thioredoxin-like negative regulator of GroEL